MYDSAASQLRFNYVARAGLKFHPWRAATRMSLALTFSFPTSSESIPSNQVTVGLQTEINDLRNESVRTNICAYNLGGVLGNHFHRGRLIAMAVTFSGEI